MTITVVIKHDSRDVKEHLFVDTFHKHDCAEDGSPDVLATTTEIQPGEQGVFMVHPYRYLIVRERHR